MMLNVWRSLACFNSTLVRLEVGLPTQLIALGNSFNSTLVRLEGVFQPLLFRYGVKVSIPHWFD